jgi:hypothetical protein
MVYRRDIAAWLEIARSFVGVACLLAALLGFAAAIFSGVHVATLLLVPIAMLVAALSSPMTLMLLIVAALALHGLALSSAVVISALRKPAALTAAHSASLSPSTDPIAALDPSADAEMTLRRRLEAGIIGATRFREGMLPLLKDRYTRGDLTLAEYEAALDRLVQSSTPD